MPKDPVENKVREKEESKQFDEMRTLDIANLSLEDFKPLDQKTAVSSHPFDGYPTKMVKVGTYMVKGKEKDLMRPRHSVIALNPKEVVFKDPSGNKQSVTNRKTGESKIVDIHAPHNRCVVDYENGGSNNDICFDRDIITDDGKVLSRCAFVLSHSARAQIMFKLDQKGERILVDRRYLLLDSGQGKRLRRVFEMIINPKIKTERLARAISGESEDDLDSFAD